MIRLSDNIISPLGDSTALNYAAVKSGGTGLRLYEGRWELPEPFTASLFSDRMREQVRIDGFTEFESFAISSIRKALDGLSIDKKRTVLILSTTKGEVASLKSTDERPESLYPGYTARRIASAVGITTEPVVVCNACISGLSAIILAQRLLEAGEYEYAVVCGIDLQSPFIVSGFQSFKALSPEPCRPFDMERLGLNLGEAAATIVFGAEEHPGEWRVAKGAVRNDAWHISAPSGKAEGAYLALKAVEGEVRPSFINAHGTATMFNDQMESVAIRRAGLLDVPVNGLKGSFGHTMGACGVLETILCMAAADDGTVLGTKGFRELGVSGQIDVRAEAREAGDGPFVKMLSGFGGCNAAVSVEKAGTEKASPETSVRKFCCAGKKELHRVRITPGTVEVDGKVLETARKGYAMLTEVFKSLDADYPKFYKMDPLSRLGFLASELLLRAEAAEGTSGASSEETAFRSDRAVVLFNRSSSIATDRKFCASIEDRDSFFPSPALFVYTLPNIVTGEIAIRNRYRGETSFYILPEKDERLMSLLLDAASADPDTRSAVSGWLDYEDELHFTAEMCIFAFEKQDCYGTIDRRTER